MPEEFEERMRSALLSFVDFLYAVVFALVLAETFTRVILPVEKTILEKTSNLILVIGVFYFLSWDWLHARRLTLKNPYTSYRRFFIEVVISFSAYGAALEAVRMEVTFLIYIFVGLLLGAIWARSTLQEYPQSEDAYELRFIQRYQTRYTFVGVSALFLWYYLISAIIRLQESIAFVLFGIIFVFWYDLRVDRPAGIMGGPRVPFINKNRVDRIRTTLSRYFPRMERR